MTLPKLGASAVPGSISFCSRVDATYVCIVGRVANIPDTGAAKNTPAGRVLQRDQTGRDEIAVQSSHSVTTRRVGPVAFDVEQRTND